MILRKPRIALFELSNFLTKITLVLNSILMNLFLLIYLFGNLTLVTVQTKYTVAIHEYSRWFFETKITEHFTKNNFKVIT